MILLGMGVLCLIAPNCTTHGRHFTIQNIFHNINALNPIVC